MVSKDADAASAGYAVGYGSPSQFSREYHWMFGAPPRQHMNQLTSLQGNVSGYADSIRSGATLPGKDPIKISAMLAKVSGVVDQTSGLIGDIRGKLGVTLNTATATIGNINGLMTDARRGPGAIGMLLNDRKTVTAL